MPDNHPVWTCVQIGRLSHDAMRVEIEVSAFDPEGAREAGLVQLEGFGWDVVIDGLAKFNVFISRIGVG